jgi:hypothetical protein
MVSDLDIWRAANLRIRNQAPTPSSRLPDMMLDRSDNKGRPIRQSCATAAPPLFRTDSGRAAACFRLADRPVLAAAELGAVLAPVPPVAAALPA